MPDAGAWLRWAEKIKDTAEMNILDSKKQLAKRSPILVAGISVITNCQPIESSWDHDKTQPLTRKWAGQDLQMEPGGLALSRMGVDGQTGRAQKKRGSPPSPPTLNQLVRIDRARWQCLQWPLNQTLLLRQPIAGHQIHFTCCYYPTPNSASWGPREAAASGRGSSSVRRLENMPNVPERWRPALRTLGEHSHAFPLSFFRHLLVI